MPAVARSITAYDVEPRRSDHRVRASTPDRPYEIFAVENGDLRCLTKQNDTFLAQIQLGRVEETKFKSADGTEVHGFLVHPPNEKPGAETARRCFVRTADRIAIRERVRFRETALCRQWLCRDPAEPARLDRTRDRLRDGDLRRMGQRRCAGRSRRGRRRGARGIADPDRLVVGGWSYGGMSTNYLIATTTRFKAAVSGASISNILAGYGTDQYIRDYEYELGSPWAHPEVWTKVSYPFLHADKIKTPTLFLCGESDFNVPLLNSEQMYQALRTLGVPTELVIYPGQFHGLKKPSYILDRYQRYLAWFAKVDSK